MGEKTNQSGRLLCEVHVNVTAERADRLRAVMSEEH